MSEVHEILRRLRANEISEAYAFGRVQARLSELASCLDQKSELVAAKAAQFTTRPFFEAAELLARAACYQECAGLIREVLK